MNFTKEDVVFAKPEDIPQIVAYAFATYKEMGLTTASPSFNKITLDITNAVVNEVVLVVRNKEDSKLLDGVIVLKHASPWWSEEVMLQQLFFYTNPNIRGNGVFDLLLDAASEYGIMNKLTIQQTIVGKDALRKAKILKRKGYTQIGVNLLKD